MVQSSFVRVIDAMNIANSPAPDIEVDCHFIRKMVLTMHIVMTYTGYVAQMVESSRYG